MSDRYHSLTVTLRRDLPQVEAQILMDAIRQFAEVADVSPLVADPTSLMGIVRARNELTSKLWDVLYPKEKP